MTIQGNDFYTCGSIEENPYFVGEEINVAKLAAHVARKMTIAAAATVVFVVVPW